MPIFIVKGRQDGEEITKQIEAPNKDKVIEEMRKQKIIISSITEKGKKDISINLQFGTGITTKDLTIFTRQFATMINAGLPLIQCLEILAQQLDNLNLRKVVSKVMEDVEGGSTLAEALQKHPKVFNKLFVHMVAAGEAGGILDNVLNRLAVTLEKSEKLAAEVKGAMVMPAVVLSVAVLVVSGLLIFVIPTFDKMFAEAGAKLPLPTLILVNASKFLVKWWWLMILVVVSISVSFSWYKSTSSGQKVIDAIILKLPLVGDLGLKGAVASFSRTLGTLISSGVNIIDALEITAKTTGNRVVQDAIYSVRDSIKEGKTIAEPLKKSGVFPPMVCQMINVGESTGAIDEMLIKIADFYDEEVDAAIKAMTSALEPMIMVGMGSVLGFVVIGLYMPIFGMAGAMGGGGG